MRFATGPSCRKCGKPLIDEEDPYIAPGATLPEYCPDCLRMRHSYDQCISVFRYRSVSRAIYRFKYAGRQEYADYFAEAACAMYGELLQMLRPDALIPVPLHRDRERERGYDQSWLLSRAIGERLGIPVERSVLRIHPTVPMKELDEQARRNNLENAFIMARDGVRYRCVIVIDDIYTTGSTLDAVAGVLRGSGTGEIYGLTLAIGQN